MDFLVIEAEGLPDIAGARQVYGLAPDLADKDVAKVMFHHHLHSGDAASFLPPHLRTIAAVSLVRCRDDRMERQDLSATAGGERELLGELARAFARQMGPFLVWDGGRNVSTWFAVRALVHRTTWGRSRAQRLEAEVELDPTVPVIARHHLAGRLDIRCAAIPHDESNWQAFRQAGEGRLVERCALNAVATTHLWLRHCLVRDAITADEHKALSDQLTRMTARRMTDAA